MILSRGASVLSMDAQDSVLEVSPVVIFAGLSSGRLGGCGEERATPPVEIPTGLTASNTTPFSLKLRLLSLFWPARGGNER